MIPAPLVFRSVAAEGNLFTEVHEKIFIQHNGNMGREEQIEEREVLDSIFPDEITDISETSYKVTILLDVEHQDEEAEQRAFNQILPHSAPII